MLILYDKIIRQTRILEKSNSDMDFTLHTGRKIPASRIAFRTGTNFSIGMKMSQRAPSLKAFDVEFRHTGDPRLMLISLVRISLV